ncbi:MAG: hypothetical protein ACTSQF_06000 [Candidatus Heimdallarchaeaceae archaeon]
MTENAQYIHKTFSCDHCGKMLECKIEKKQLEELRDSQLFNFVLMHADDHTLIISIDGRGDIRRARTASLGSSISQESEFSHLEIYHALDKCDNIVDAFNVFLKNK